jgi:ParB family chromosome partitioning protein
MKVDPRALKDNPDRRARPNPARRPTPAPGNDQGRRHRQPPVIFAAETGGGNGYVIEIRPSPRQAGDRRRLRGDRRLVVEAANDNGAMRSLAANIARER